MAARAAAEAGADVCVISKTQRGAPNCTTRAWGGATYSTDETADELVAQIVDAAGLLSNQRLVRALAEDIPARLADLAAVGVETDEPMLTSPEMPGVVRWSYRGKDSGLAVTDLIVAQAEGAGVKFMFGQVAVRVLTADGQVAGLAAIDLETREATIFQAPTVLIATGGGAGMYTRNDSAPANTGDGIVIAYEAGADLVDLECITFNVPPKRVPEFLAASPAPDEELLELGHAHYFMGGVRIDAEGATTMPGLYAAGEATGGLFGAARLGGAALADCLVFGHRAGLAAADYARESAQVELPEADVAEVTALPDKLQAGTADPDDVAERLREINWRWMGSMKSAATLTRELQELANLDDEVAALGARGGDAMRTALEVRGMRTLAELVARACLMREETRGCYWRTDFPRPDDAQLRNIIVRRTESGPALTAEPLVLTEITSIEQVRVAGGCFGYTEAALARPH
jgi:succinate dehydrogenase/fumarate reductase flavoprotein subunit